MKNKEYKLSVQSTADPATAEAWLNVQVALGFRLERVDVAGASAWFFMSREVKPDRAPIDSSLKEVEAVLAEVANYFGFPVARLYDADHSTPLVEARHVAMYLACKLVRGMSYSKLGRILKKNHSTVMSGCRKMRGRLLLSTDFAQQVQEIESRLNRSNGE